MMKTGFFVAGFLILSGCSDGCSNSVVARANSPDGLHTAIMFQRDCGATTGFSTQVSIVERDGAPSGGGNTFRADDDHGVAADGGWGGPWAQMTWLAADRLLIRYAATSRIFAQEEAVSGVKISYQQVTR